MGTTAAAAQEQLEQMALKVDIYKNHPALLGWGVGNELEHLDGPTDNGDQEAIEQIWMAIEQAAQMIKKKDPLHPTFCVTADMGAWHPVDNCTRITELCPSIDICHGLIYNTVANCALQDTSRKTKLIIPLNIISKSGTWFSYNETRIGQGRENSKKFLRDNPEMAADIEKQLRETLGLTDSELTPKESAEEPSAKEKKSSKNS